MQEREKRETAYTRSNIYKLLSVAFIRELTPESIGFFRSENMRETLKDMDIDFGNEFYNCSEDEVLNALAEEYAALFILPGGINPTESVARSGLYMQPYAAQVVKFYRQCGFVLPGDFRGFPDHIGVELEFISHLSKNEAGAYEEGKPDEAGRWKGFQRIFMENHLSQWVPAFAKDVAAYARQPFYGQMALLLYEFMQMERIELQKDQVLKPDKETHLENPPGK